MRTRRQIDPPAGQNGTEPLLFLIYINDLHRAIIYSRVYHFADDTNFLNISDSPKQMQKQVYDLYERVIELRNEVDRLKLKVTILGGDPRQMELDV